MLLNMLIIKARCIVKKRINTTIHRFGDDQRGVAAIEFALFALILFSLVFGSFAIFDAMRAKRTLVATSAIVVDLSTRVSQMNDAIRDDIFAASLTVMGRYASSNHSFVISSIGNPRGGGDILEVVWSETNGSGRRLSDTDISGLDLPAIPDGTAVIVVQGKMSFKPFVGSDFLPSTINLDEVAIRSPRFVSEICYTRSARIIDCVD